jgi:hypothetical protein
MERRQYTREFKLEAVRLIKERGISYAQASGSPRPARGERSNVAGSEFRVRGNLHESRLLSEPLSPQRAGRGRKIYAASRPRLFAARIGRTSRPKRSASSSCR